MTQDISSSQSQDTDGLAIYRGLEPGWYRPTSDAAYARYWDGSTLHDELCPVMINGTAHASMSNGADHASEINGVDGALSANLLFEEATTQPDLEEPVAPAPPLSPDALVSRAKGLLGHDDGAGAHIRRRGGSLTRILIGLGAVLVLLAIIDEIGGDSNDMALGTAIIGLCFIVAVAADATLNASKLGSRSIPVRRPSQRGWQPKRTPSQGRSSSPQNRTRR